MLLVKNFSLLQVRSFRPIFGYEMGMRTTWGYWCRLLIFSLSISQIGSDWLSCAQIVVCQCKWSSGKKTASCVSGGLVQPPHLASDIQNLDLHDNPLQVLNQDAFGSIGLLNLQRINLSSTSIRSLHPDAFRELRILIELDLSQNEITQLSPNTFHGNDRLRLLVLSDNPISNLVANQFPSLPHLRRIELARCRLHSIHPTAFTKLYNLEMVQIHQNVLFYLHKNTFNLPKLKTLTLSDNPWYCDCRLRDFHEWFINSNLGNEEVICGGPENKKNVSWRDITGNDMVCLPKAISSPSVIRTEAGAEISFGCFVRGDPIPKVTWIFNDIEVDNYTFSEIYVNRSSFENFNDYSDDVMNRSAQWVNVTISNVTSDIAGEWVCKAKSSVGEAKTFSTLVLPKARTATARVAPDYSTLFMVVGSTVAMLFVGCIAAIVCWKTRRRRVPPSRSFTDQEKKLLDTSLAVSCDRTSAEMGSSYGFEMLDRSMSLESEDTQRCLDPVHISIEGPSGRYPPPPAEFALPAPYGNIFISVQVSNSKGEEYPDILSGGATLPRRSRTCFIKSAYDNMGPRITATGSSTWSLPGGNSDQNIEIDPNIPEPLSKFSTEFTAL